MLTLAIESISEQVEMEFESCIPKKQMLEEVEWEQLSIEHEILKQQHEDECYEERKMHDKEDLHGMTLKEK
jgi:hypothetical protein